MMPTPTGKGESMIDFLDEYKYYFLLGASMFLPFILSLYKAITQNQKTRVVVFLITTGFIITLSMAVVNDIQKRNREKMALELDKKKKAIITEISNNVVMTMNTSTETLKTAIDAKVIGEKSLTLLENMERTLEGKGFSDVAVNLVGMGNENILYFHKANISKLPNYVEWLENITVRAGDSPEGRIEREPALSFVFNAGHTYRLEMILGYLIAKRDNIDKIMTGFMIDENEESWRRFPEGSDLSIDQLTNATTKYVLFYDRDKKNLIGFADATLFVREILLHKQNGNTAEIEKVFNMEGRATAESLKAQFASFNATVIQVATPYDAAKALIDGKKNEAVAIYQEKPWRVSLAKIVEIAM